MNPRGTSLLNLPDIEEPAIVKGDVQLAKGKGGPGGPAVNPASLNQGAGGAPGEVTGPGAPGGAGGGKGKGKGGGRGGKGFANLTPAQMVQMNLDQYDGDKDEKLSTAEIDAMPEFLRTSYSGGDKNSDGFLDKTELTTIATEFRKRMEEFKSKGGGGFGGGPPGGAPGGGGGGVPGGGP